MALIKCPECGKDVSSNAKQCVHCGCKFSICNECGVVFASEVNVCPNCGYQIAKSENNSKNENANSNNIPPDVFSKLKDRSKKEQTVLKTLKLTSIGFDVIAVIFIIIPVLMITTVNTESLDELLKLIDNQKLFHTFIIFSCIFGCLSFCVDELKDIYSEVLLGIWLKNNRIYMPQYFRKHKGEFIVTKQLGELSFKNILSATYISEEYNAKTTKIIQYGLRIIIASIIAVFCGMFLIQTADTFVLEIITGSRIDLEYTYLIIAGALLWFNFIVSVVMSIYFVKCSKKWVKSLESKADSQTNK